MKLFLLFFIKYKKKIKKLKISNKKFNRKAIEILRNVELLCFMKPRNINKFADILKLNLNSKEKYKELYEYINEYYIKKNPKLFNFSFIIDYSKNNNKENYLKKLYLTNNIEESIHSKIDFYLQKTSTSNNTLINTIEQIFINNQFKKEDIIRYDYVTQTLIAMIDDLKLMIFYNG